MMNLEPIPPVPTDNLPVLMQLLGSAAESKARLKALTEATERATRATAAAHAAIGELERKQREQEAVLTRERSVHDAALGVERVELERRRIALTEQERELASDRERLAVERKYVDEIKAEASELGTSINEVLADPNWFALTGGTPSHAA
jgi:hypothetical protein